MAWKWGVGFCFWNWKVMHFNILIALNLHGRLLVFAGLELSIRVFVREGHRTDPETSLASIPAALDKLWSKSFFLGWYSVLYYTVFLSAYIAVWNFPIPQHSLVGHVIHELWKFTFRFTNLRKRPRDDTLGPEQHLGLKGWGKDEGISGQEHIMGKGRGWTEWLAWCREKEGSF